MMPVVYGQPLYVKTTPGPIDGDASVVRTDYGFGNVGASECIIAGLGDINYLINIFLEFYFFTIINHEKLQE